MIFTVVFPVGIPQAAKFVLSFILTIKELHEKGGGE